jgi:hypothetical protein
MFITSSHLNSLSFFKRLEIGLAISKKFGINLLIKFIFPKKDFIDFLFFDKGIFWMASILVGSIVTPSLGTTCPSDFPSSTPKIVFFWI